MGAIHCSYLDYSTLEIVQLSRAFGLQLVPETAKNPLWERVYTMEPRGVEPLSEDNAT